MGWLLKFNWIYIWSFVDIIRNASKKTGGSTRNPKEHPRPKHRGWRVQDGHYVAAGTILATQLKTRFHPGLNVRHNVQLIEKIIFIIDF